MRIFRSICPVYYLYLSTLLSAILCHRMPIGRGELFRAVHVVVHNTLWMRLKCGQNITERSPSVTFTENQLEDSSASHDPPQVDGDTTEEQDRSSESEKLPMSGVRIIDVGTFLAGPYAASILGEFGAEVLKVC